MAVFGKITRVSAALVLRDQGFPSARFPSNGVRISKGVRISRVQRARHSVDHFFPMADLNSLPSLTRPKLESLAKGFQWRSLEMDVWVAKQSTDREAADRICGVVNQIFEENLYFHIPQWIEAILARMKKELQEPTSLKGAQSCAKIIRYFSDVLYLFARGTMAMVGYSKPLPISEIEDLLVDLGQLNNDNGKNAVVEAMKKELMGLKSVLENLCIVGDVGPTPMNYENEENEFQ